MAPTNNECVDCQNYDEYARIDTLMHLAINLRLIVFILCHQNIASIACVYMRLKKALICTKNVEKLFLGD